jgi:type I restriction enzyme S subunit
VPWVKTLDLSDRWIDRTQEHVTTDAVSSSRLHLQKIGTVLVAMYGGFQQIGRSGILRMEATTNQAICALELDPSRVFSEFCNYWLVHSRPRWRSIAASSRKDPNVTKEDVRRFAILIPSLGEQRKIAAILSSVDDAIEGTQAVIDQLQVVKKAMMADLLTRGIPGRHKKFKQTEIGEVPEEWDVVPLGDLLTKGPDNGLYKHQSVYGEGVRIVRIDAFSNGENVAEETLKRVRIDQSERERFQLAPDDILVNRVNSLSHIAKVGFVRALSETTVFESNIMRVAVDPAKVLPKFGFAQLSSERAREYFLGRAKQAVAQVSVNQQDVKHFPVLLPGIAEQMSIVAALEAASQRLRSETESLDAAIKTKSALMSVLLTGEVRVRLDEEEAA